MRYRALPYELRPTDTPILPPLPLNQPNLSSSYAQ
jgi:hypothetical protein